MWTKVRKMIKWIEDLQHRELEMESSAKFQKNPRNKKTADVKYSCFLECLPYAENEFMIELLKKAARDHLPKNCSIRNKALAYTCGNKSISVKLDYEPKILYERLRDLATQHLGLVLSIDASPSPVTDDPKTWKQITSRDAKRRKLEYFVQSCGYEFGWDYDKIEKEIQKLLDFLLTKKIKTANIVMENDKIVEIKKVTVNADGLEYTGLQKVTKTKAKNTFVFVGNLYRQLPQKSRKIEGDSSIYTIPSYDHNQTPVYQSSEFLLPINEANNPSKKPPNREE